MGLNASQIRRDFNCFGGFGQQGYGYQVKKLKDELIKILGLDQTYRCAIVGSGNIGRALLLYKGFEMFQMNAIFDVNPESLGQRWMASRCVACLILMSMSKITTSM